MERKTNNYQKDLIKTDKQIFEKGLIIRDGGSIKLVEGPMANSNYGQK